MERVWGVFRAVGESLDAKARWLKGYECGLEHGTGRGERVSQDRALPSKATRMSHDDVMTRSVDTERRA